MICKNMHINKMLIIYKVLLVPNSVLIKHLGLSLIHRIVIAWLLKEQIKRYKDDQGLKKLDNALRRSVLFRKAFHPVNIINNQYQLNRYL